MEKMMRFMGLTLLASSKSLSLKTKNYFQEEIEMMRRHPTVVCSMLIIQLNVNLKVETEERENRS